MWLVSCSLSFTTIMDLVQRMGQVDMTSFWFSALRLVVSACLLASGPATVMSRPASAQSGAPDTLHARFGRELDDAARAPDFVGLAVAVVEDGKVVLMKTYGVCEAGQADPVTPDTVFRLASLSKGFAGTLAVLEHADGRLDLRQRVTSLVPEFMLKRQRDAQRVTFEDVLAHRTGLPPYAYDNLLEAGRSPAEILSRYANVSPVCAPGACFTYQNTAFNMITAAIEKASGKPYEAELHARIFRPLGMRTASLGSTGLRASGNWARPHRLINNVWSPTPVTEAYYKLPAAGGVNASIRDMSSWLIAQMGYRPDVLPQEVLQEAHRTRIRTPAETARQRTLKTHVRDTAYALGWRIFDYAGHTLITHSGSLEGYAAEIAWLPDARAGIVVLANTRGARASKIVPAWLDHQLGLTRTDWFRMGGIVEASKTAGGPDSD